MRAIVQRVVSSSVTVEGEVVGRIGLGINVLLGIHRDDTETDVQEIIKRLLRLKLWPSEDGRPWQKSVVESEYDVLLVSQFTLFARLNKGKKPDFSLAMGADGSRSLFDFTVASLREQYLPDRVQTGSFGAMMQVSIDNDGPVTIVIDSREHSQSRSGSTGDLPSAASSASSE